MVYPARVCLRSGEAVDEVDIQQRRLRIAETWLPWDELVFATGSRPFIPPLPGIDRPQVMPFRTLADVERILAIPGPAVVIGGGVLGWKRRRRCVVTAERSLFCIAAAD